MDLDTQQKQKKVGYHLVGRRDGKQTWWSLSSFEDVDPFSLEDAKDVETKLKVNKREGRLEVFKVRKETTITFKEIATWYLDLVSIKKIASFDRVIGLIENFNKEFGGTPVSPIRPVALENYQDRREEQGASSSTIYMEISRVNAMIRKAFDNDKINGDALKAFRVF